MLYLSGEAGGASPFSCEGTLAYNIKNVIN